MHDTEGNIFTNKKCVAMSVRCKKKQSFGKNVNFGMVALSFHYGSCCNASLSRYIVSL